MIEETSVTSARSDALPGPDLEHVEIEHARTDQRTRFEEAGPTKVLRPSTALLGPVAAIRGRSAPIRSR
jgi:hypothetical protein